LSERLQEASSRINAVGRAYDRLAYNADYEDIDLVGYLREVVEDLESVVAPCKIHFKAPEKIRFGADRAILVALVINELVSNAGKYAYPDGSGGSIWVSVLQPEKNAVLLTVRDEGVGMPAHYDPTTSKRLGSRLVNALGKQLSAEITRPVSRAGTNITLRVQVTSSPDKSSVT